MENQLNDLSNTQYIKLDELLPTLKYPDRQDDEFLNQFLDDIKMEYNEEDEIIMSITQFYYLVHTVVTKYEIFRHYGHFEFGNEMDDTLKSK